MQSKENAEGLFLLVPKMHCGALAGLFLGSRGRLVNMCLAGTVDTSTDLSYSAATCLNMHVFWKPFVYAVCMCVAAASRVVSF